MAKRFKLTKENVLQVAQVIHKWILAQSIDSLPLEVVIKPYKRNRSLQQNARLHKIIGECSKESGYTIDEMKMEFKKELLPPIGHFDYKGHKCPVFKSTKDMKVDELNEFMEQVENLAAKWYGVRLPHGEH